MKSTKAPFSLLLSYLVFEYSKLSRNKFDHEDFETLSSSRVEDIQEVSDGKIRLEFDEAVEDDSELLPKTTSQFHSLIALNIHTYATEQIAFLDPSFDPRLVLLYRKFNFNCMGTKSKSSKLFQFDKTK